MIKTLQRARFFKDIEDEEIKKILDEEVYMVRSYNKGQIIANQGEPCNSLSIIVEGKAVVQNVYENGKVLTLANLSEGDAFAEAIIFAKEGTYPSTVMAIENCKIIFFPKKTILNIMKKNTKFTENFLGLLSQKLVNLNKKIKLIELDSIRRKICKLLLDNYNTKNSLVLKIKSKKELAEEMGVARPSLSRELISMKNSGLIDFNLKEIRILDLEKIEDEFFD
ncbi:Crp/Fnr family transcriptional regulator [Clostridium isatidis]|mgnify:FL=1|uniref:Transcriptional regulator n=1 Tax=Clostridium isatidis TaxID=182773 RepID=A0A343JDT8_9CLOT|nr:Crp/Fnr family transcriptional regulator [Clostridium isatidis]ASW43696.1 transcriptional regulator [Clostridium isatidis]NLZ35151.1 Crp/Fnr family transcriptional regulator [Clostridiales bacterium]